MLQTVHVNVAVDVDLARYEDVVSRSCRDILLSGLHEKAYSGDLTDFVSLGLVETGLRHAYEKIIRLMHHIVDLRRVHNSLTSVARLPPEILLQVFRLCVPLLDKASGARRWLAFSQVCSTWRNMALADPSLWTQLNLSRLNLSKLLIRRSWPLPVSIHTVSHKELLELLADRPRVKALTLRQLTAASREAVESGMNRYLSASFSSLETLELRGFQYTSSWDVTSAEMPRLRSLTLVNWVLSNWNTRLMSNLTFLNISRPRVRADHLWGSVLDMLRGCPRLVSLTLQGFGRIFSLPLIGVRSTQPVKFSHLQQLELHEQLSAVNSLLQHISLPVLADLSIGCCDVSEGTAGLRDLVDTLSHSLLEAGWAALESAALELGSDIVTMVGWPSKVLPPATRSCLLKVALLDIPTIETVDFLSSLMLTPPFRKLKAFRFGVHSWHRSPGGTSGMLLNPLCALVSALPTLEVMELKGCKCHSFLSLLLALVPSLAIMDLEDDIPRPVDPFPVLRTLTLRMLRLERTVHNEPMLTHLCKFLDWRRQKGKPFTVFLDECETGVVNAVMLEAKDIHVVT